MRIYSISINKAYIRTIGIVFVALSLVTVLGFPMAVTWNGSVSLLGTLLISALVALPFHNRVTKV